MQAASTGRARLKAWGLGRAERTLNISFMFVTLDVSKLIGWLNDFHRPCRVKSRACDAGSGTAREA